MTGMWGGGGGELDPGPVGWGVGIRQGKLGGDAQWQGCGGGGARPWPSRVGGGYVRVSLAGMLSGRDVGGGGSTLAQ